jgi:hypothetical protein
MQDYDKSLGRKEDKDLPLKYTTTPDGGVDYLDVSRGYEKYLVKSGFIKAPGKKQKK